LAPRLSSPVALTSPFCKSSLFSDWHGSSFFHNREQKVAKMAPKRSWTSEKIEVLKRVVEQGDSTNEVASVCRICLSELSEILSSSTKATRLAGFGELISRAREAALEITDTRRDAIVAILDCTLNQQQVADELTTDLRCTRRTISKALHQLQYSRKKLTKIPAERNSASNISTWKLRAHVISRKANVKLLSSTRPASTYIQDLAMATHR
jgi:transposase